MCPEARVYPLLAILTTLEFPEITGYALASHPPNETAVVATFPPLARLMLPPIVVFTEATL